MNSFSSADNRRNAIITGGASGIGLCTARLFLERQWKVAIIDADKERGEKSAGQLRDLGQVHFIRCDVSQAGDVRQAVAAAIAQFERIDVLVNNAALLGPEDFASSSDSDLAQVLAVNLFGPLCLCKHVIEHMVTNGGGGIVNVASIASLVGAPNYPAYAASKSGLVGLTKSLARRYARNNIRINCISPGSVQDTDLRFRSCNKRYSTKEQLAMASRLPMGRLLRPAEVAEMIFLMTSPAANAMTGANIVLDGGETLALR